MEATVSFGHDTKELKKDGSQVGSKRKFLKRKAGEFLQKAKKKAGMASAQAQVSAYNKGREVAQTVGDKTRKAKQAVSDAPKKAKSGIKSFLKKKAQKVVDRMSEEIVGEAVYGGTPPEKKDTRMVVTNADKKANTPAYQKMKAGDKRYKSADHMGEDVEVEEGYKELSRGKRNTMFRKAGNLARTALQGGDKGTEAHKKSGKIVKALNKDAEKYNRNDVKKEEVTFSETELESIQAKVDSWEEGYQRNPEKGEAEARKSETSGQKAERNVRGRLKTMDPDKAEAMKKQMRAVGLDV